MAAPALGLAALACLAAACAETSGGPSGDAADGRDEAADGSDADSGCRPGETPCPAGCSDVRSDPANCGACGRRCEAGEVCNEGVCASTCRTGLENCSGACVDLQSDESHCGDCATTCLAIEECRSAACECVPQCSGRVCGDNGCGGVCGTCGAGFTCAAGACTCPGTACGIVCCASGQVCASGACCTPLCAGRTCGDDGCGGVCGTCGAGFECTAGTCSCPGTTCGAECCGSGRSCISGECCASTWRTDFPGAHLSDVAVDGDGTVFASGADGDYAYVARLDSCGTTLGEARFRDPAALTYAASHLAISGADLFVAGLYTQSGADPGNGMWARLDKGTLSVAWYQGLWGAPESQDEVWGIVASGGGYLWMTGVTDVAAGRPYHIWTIKGSAAGAACGWDPFPESAGVGRGIASSAGRVWTTGAIGSDAFVTSWAASEASPTEPCATIPSGPTISWRPSGADYAEGRGLAVAGSVIHIAGFSSTGGSDIAGMATRIVGTTPTSAPSWNPTSGADGFSSAAIDITGTSLFVTGTTNWDLTWEDGTVGTAVLARYNAAIPALDWAAYPSGMVGCWDLAIDAAGGIVVACASPARSIVMRCLPGGVCP